MSLWSTFYFGDAKRIQTYVGDERFAELENAPEIEVVDFSGGVKVPVLFPDGFDLLFRCIRKGSKDSQFPFSKFREACCELIWGAEVNSDAENQAFTLKPEFTASFARVSDEALIAFSKEWNEYRSKAWKAEESRFRRRAFERRFRKEMGFWALPVAASLCFNVANHGSLPLYWKVGGPVAVIVLALLVRKWARNLFGYAEASSKGSEPEPVDWVGPLQDLREACSRATRKGSDAVYLWSL